MIKSYTLKIIVLIGMINGLSAFKSYCQDEKKIEIPDSTKKKKVKQYFELSLGSTLLFISGDKLDSIKSKAAVIVPTSTRLFFAEFRPARKLKIPVFLSLPIQTKQYIVNGELVEKRASPTFGAGLEFRVFKLPIGTKSALEFELGPLISVLINENAVLRFAPLAAGRLRFMKNEDYIIYFGGSYSVGINAFGVLSGIGYVF